MEKNGIRTKSSRIATSSSFKFLNDSKDIKQSSSNLFVRNLQIKSTSKYFNKHSKENIYEKKFMNIQKFETFIPNYESNIILLF